jgi:hypothetical protein
MAHKSAGMNRKSVQAKPMLGHFSKSDLRYWQRAIFRQSYTRNSQTFLTRAWAMKVAHEGRRSTFPLGTANKAAAAAKARDVYLFLVANGWEAALARHKKAKRIALEQRTEGLVTVGEFLEEVFRIASNQQTIESYAKAFRQIISEIFGLAEGTDRYDYRQGG